jgi:hypothetical protein
MQRNRFKYVFATFCCLMLLGTLLLLSGCGNYNSPGSPNGTPKPGGYSLISILDKEIPQLLAPQSR